MSQSYSHATNFTDRFQASVNPRTGAFFAQLELASIEANTLRGPTFPLTLVYSPFSEQDVGLGLGWSLNWTVYDRASKLLSVGSGEQLVVGNDNVEGPLSLNQSKVSSIKFIRAGDSAYQAWHDDGTLEILSGSSSAYSTKVPEKWFGADGMRLSFDWEANGDVNWFSGCQDAAGQVVCAAAYDGESSATITIWPGTPDARVFQLVFSQRKLISIKEGDFIWRLFYDDTLTPTPPLLTKIRHPQGLVETATYTREGHRYPNAPGVPSERVPYVVKFVKDAGLGQEPLTYEIEFTETNYLGYDSGLQVYRSGEDNLYNCPDQRYSYASSFKLVSALGDVITTRRYNKYHLLLSETVSSGKCSRSRLSEYGYLDLAKPYDAQASNFQCVTKVTAVYSDGDDMRSASEDLEWDEAGKIRRYLYVDGTQKTWDYYPAGGDGDACPPDLGGKGIYVKQITVTPGEGGGAPVRRAEFTYAKVTVDGDADDPLSPMTYGVAPAKTREYADEVLIRSTEYAYVDTTSSSDHGRTRLYTDTLYSGEEARTTTVHFRYILAQNDSVLTTEQTAIGFDGKSDKSSLTRSTTTGRIISTLDQSGVLTVFTYDVHGRETSRTVAPGTSYERTWSTVYSSDENGDGEIQDRSTPYGETVRHVFDGMGRKLSRQRQIRGQWEWLNRWSYDSRGALSQTETRDWVDPQEGEASFLQIWRFEYDDWGQQWRMSCNDGSCFEQFKDPIRLQVRQRRPDGTLGYSFLFDPKNLRLSHANRVDIQGEVVSTESYTYDGAGRRVSETDPQGRTTTYEYDAFDRVVKHILPDTTEIFREYAIHTTEPFSQSIRVNKDLLGTQIYDGLMRLSSVSSGGRVQRFLYRGSYRSPYEVWKPTGEKVRYTYIPELDDRVARSELVGKDFSRTYSYDRFGAMVSAQQSAPLGGPALEMRYDDWGRLIEHAVDWSSSVSSSSYSYSLDGLPTLYTGEAGEQWKFSYDQYGRTTGCTVGDLVLGASYDDYGRLSGWRIEDGDRAQQTTLSFDGFDREIRRETAYSKSGLRLVIEQDWDKNDALHARRTYVNGDLLREETYGYDERTRLVTYACTGRELPTDVHGKRLQSQTFKYDALSNIRSVGTVFEGGEDEATYGFDNSEDPCQLTWIRHTHADYPAYAELRYDAAGRMVRDERGRQLSYDAFGRLTSVSGADGAISYAYDAMDVLRLRTGSNGTRRELYYQNGTVSAVLDESGAVTSFLRIAGQVLAQRRSDAKTLLLATDVKSSVVAVESEDASSVLGYTPYGYRAADAQGALLGYNGELLDGEVGYHLGNGYRVYSPTLMRFTSPDAWSPFGAGGVNAYAYCEGDPINRSDPSGHLSTRAWIQIAGTVLALTVAIVLEVATLGVATPLVTALAVGAIGLSIAGSAASIGAVIEGDGAQAFITYDSNGNPVEKNNGKAETAQILDWVGIGLGIATLAVGGYGGIRYGVPRVGRGIKSRFSSKKESSSVEEIVTDKEPESLASEPISGEVRFQRIEGPAEVMVGSGADLPPVARSSGDKAPSTHPSSRADNRSVHFSDRVEVFYIPRRGASSSSSSSSRPSPTNAARFPRPTDSAFGAEHHSTARRGEKEKGSASRRSSNPDKRRGGN
ncbi:MAG: RHS repeat-associated core domain-containing protein [Achromobacter sp.]|uniref:RHS repeat-associated core domain-containing protein n=1 Tax=Achromobacter sp. TaxID=134375 RepID=UPI003D0334D5